MGEVEDKVAFWREREELLQRRKERMEYKLDIIRERITRYLKPKIKKKEVVP